MIIKIEVLWKDPSFRWSNNKVQLTDDKLGVYTVHLSHNSLKKEELKLKMRTDGAKDDDIEAVYDLGYDEGRRDGYEEQAGASL